MRKSATGRRPRRWPFYLLGGALALLAAVLVLQTAVAHRGPPFVPDYPREDLAPLLSRPYRSDADYDTLFRQTGLARTAVDALLARGEVGKAQIVLIQDQFWADNEVECLPLCAIFTMEDRMTADGAPAYGPILPVLENGDVIVTFSTHSAGWRHGHAGIVVDAENGVTLEAALIGTDSQLMYSEHWRAYSNYIVLRLRDMTPELQAEFVQYCNDTLLGVPYHLTSGFIGPKAPQPDDFQFGVQCAYLVWYAFQHFGFDVDGDGGRLVSIYDLATSPLFEVVQAYGVDPDAFLQ